MKNILLSLSEQKFRYMKLASYIKEGHEQLAILVDGILYDADRLHPELPSTMSMFLNYWDDYFPLAQAINESVLEGKISLNKGIPIQTASMLAPVPQPASCRIAYGFTSLKGMYLEGYNQQQTDAFERQAAFYFANHHCIQSPGKLALMPDHLDSLDFEFQVAAVICRQGRNIPASNADEHIGGFMIMNNFNSRSMQMEASLSHLPSANGKDFATVIGPWLVTSDELTDYIMRGKEGHTGNNYNLIMKCSVNGLGLGESNTDEMHWTFAEIIERCSYGTNLYPGDIIGSGPVTHCSLLELNEARKRSDPAFKSQWLKEGDSIELEIGQLGMLESVIAADEDSFSLIASSKA